MIVSGHQKDLLAVIPGLTTTRSIKWSTENV